MIIAVLNLVPNIMKSPKLSFFLLAHNFLNFAFNFLHVSLKSITPFLLYHASNANSRQVTAKSRKSTRCKVRTQEKIRPCRGPENNPNC